MLKLSSRELKDFFVGTLLGDAYLHNNSFNCKQISKDLIEFKEDIIKRHIPSCKTKITEYPAYIDKNGASHQVSYVLYVSPHEYFKKLQEEFYPNGKKIIPKKYLRGLSPIGYAMWYADDGTTILIGFNNTTKSARSRRIQFCTDCYTKEEVNDLLQMITNQYGETTILTRKENSYRLQIQTYNSQNFLIDISKYFYKYFPSLLYKIDMGYRNESLLNRRYVREEYYQEYLRISAHPLFIDRLINR